MKRLSIVIFSAGLYSAVPVFGGAMAGGASEITQILNNVQLTLAHLEQIHQTAQQLEQLRTQIEIHKIHIENAKRLSQGDVMIIENYARQLWDHWQKQKSMAWGANEVDKLYRDKYPSFGGIMDGALDGESFPDQIERWNKESHERMKSVLQANADTRDLINGKETEFNKYLFNKTETAAGTLEVMQVANEVALAQINQIQQLRRLIASQNDAVQHIAAQERVKKDNAAMKQAHLFGPVKTPQNKKYRRPVINWGSRK